LDWNRALVVTLGGSPGEAVKSTLMEWNEYKNGYLAKTRNGYYFIYEEFNSGKVGSRWFLKYDPDTLEYQGGDLINLHGFESLDEAKAQAQEFSKETDAEKQKAQRPNTTVFPD
jgi:hypothetical protein